MDPVFPPLNDSAQFTQPASPPKVKSTGKIKSRSHIAGHRQNPLMQTTPKKVARGIQATSNLHHEYDTTRQEELDIAAGLVALKALTPTKGPKKAQLLRRWQSAAAKAVLPKELHGSDALSPRRHRSLARRLSEGSRAIPDLLSQLSSLHREMPPDVAGDWDGNPYNLEHLSSYSSASGGLHLCSPGHPDWKRLDGITEMENGTFVALVRGDLQMKYSSFWPLGTTERQITEMGSQGVKIARMQNTELLSVVLPTGAPAHAMRYNNGAVYTSFFPVELRSTISEIGHTLLFDIQTPLPSKTQVQISSADLIATVKAQVTTKVLVKADFEDRDLDIVFVDCAKYLTPLGLPPTIDRGIFFAFRTDDIGYKFKIKASACSRFASAGSRLDETPDRPRFGRQPMKCRSLAHSLFGSDDEGDAGAYGIPAIDDLSFDELDKARGGFDVEGKLNAASGPADSDDDDDGIVFA